jgi:hypothetical protein
MPATDERRHFIVKHDLQSFLALPGVIWRSDESDRVKPEKPPKFSLIQPGDRWVEFAYTKGDADDTPCSIVVGFYECVRGAWHGEIPDHRKTPQWVEDWPNRAWMIEGEPWGEQPKPVDVPPIDVMLGRKTFKQGAIISGLKAEDLEVIRREAIKRQ